MPVITDRDRARFVLTGPDIAPPDLGRYATADRRAYWRQVAVLARDAKYRELGRGLDVNGQRMLPRIRPRRDRAVGPVLIPHYADSRFRTMLRWDGTDSAAVLWWIAPWSRVVTGHARGIRTRFGRIVRDVIGLTADSLHRVIERAHAWWAARVALGRMAERAIPVEQPTVMTGQLPGAPPAPLPPWRRPPPRPTGSIFVPSPVAKEPTFGRPMPPWQLVRGWSNLMARAARGEMTATEITDQANQVGRRQSLATIRETLYRLGVDRPPVDRRLAVDLLARQALERLRSGRLPTPPRPVPPPPPGVSVIVAVRREAPDLVVVIIRSAAGRLLRREVRPGQQLLGLDFAAWMVRSVMTGLLPDTG